MKTICSGNTLHFTQLLLASQSPRRREMLTWLGLPSGLVRADVDEESRAGEHPHAMAVRLAIAKAHAITLPDNDSWVLGADTVVDLDSVSLGKPISSAEARAILYRLRGRSHAVHTGVALYHPQTRRVCTRRVTSTVQMRTYSNVEIAAYVQTGDPMDKAGAYAIQNNDFRPVERVDRCYANVVGFPLCGIAALLEAWGITMTVDIPALCLAHFEYVCPGVDVGVSL